ncbi:MAG: Ig-like domain-containing protein [Clostridiales bacterium]|jgi:hypothetical protein|nr:Ig-like domain-containing protein [Clostridiales bacterium]
MREKIKHIKKSKAAVLGLIVAALFALCLPAAVHRHTAKAAGTNIVQPTLDDFLLGTYIGYYDETVAPYSVQVADMAAAGLNYHTHPGRNYLAGYHNDLEFWRQTDALYKTYGMAYGLMDGDGSSVGRAPGGGFTAIEVLPREPDSVVAGWGKQLSNALMYTLKDEPAYSELPGEVNRLKYFADQNAAMPSFINLFPSYVGAGALGGSFAHYMQTLVDLTAAKGETLAYLAVDNYPYPEGTSGIRATYFEDLETQRRVAYDNGKLKTANFVNATEGEGTRFPTMGEARANMYNLVAYGHKLISYFNWGSPAQHEVASPAFKKSVIQPNGSRCSIYDGLVELNWEVRAMGSLLMQLDARNVYHTGLAIPQGVPALDAGYFLKPAAQSESFIISDLAHKSGGSDFVMLQNKNTELEVTSVFIVKEGLGVNGLEWFNPKTGGFEAVPVEGGSFVQSFRAGEGKLYRISGSVDTVEAPALSQPSGYYNGDVTVTLSASAPASDIYYTLDGAYPTQNGTRYQSPLTFSRGQTSKLNFVRAAAYQNGKASAVTEGVYVLAGTGETPTDLIETRSLANDDGRWTLADHPVSGAAYGLLRRHEYNTAFAFRNDALCHFNDSGSFLMQNGLLQGTFRFENTVSPGGSGGFIGFSLFSTKAAANSPESLSGDSLVTAIGVAPDGTVHAKNADGAIGERGIRVPGFDPAQAFTLRVIHFGDTLMLFVNGTPYWQHRDPAFAAFRSAAASGGKYKCGIYAGPYLMNAYDVTRVMFDEQAYQSENKLTDILVGKNIILPYRASKAELAAELPEAVTLVDDRGKAYPADVVWTADDFDGSASGFTFVEGTCDLTGLANPNGLVPRISVFVKHDLALAAIQALLSKFRDLNGTHFDPAGWQTASEAYLAAGKIVGYSFAAQTDVDSAQAALSAAIDALVRLNVDRTALLALLTRARAVEAADYTAASFDALQETVGAAQAVFDSNLSSQTDLDIALGALENALDALEAVTHPVEVIVIESVLNLFEGEVYELAVSVYPQAATDKRIGSYASDAPEVATVTPDGLVTALSEGSALITVRSADGGASATCRVNVIKKSGAAGFVFRASLHKGGRLRLGSVFAFDSGDAVVWTSLDTAVATVNAVGTVTAVELGVTTITASAGGAAAVCELTVTDGADGALIFTNNVRLRVGEYAALSASLTSDEQAVIVWTSADDSVATVTAEGVVRGIKAGQVTVTASAGGVSATCVVLVTDPPASGCGSAGTGGGALSLLAPLAAAGLAPLIGRKKSKRPKWSTRPGKSCSHE